MKYAKIPVYAYTELDEAGQEKALYDESASLWDWVRETIDNYYIKEEYSPELESKGFSNIDFNWSIDLYHIDYLVFSANLDVSEFIHIICPQYVEPLGDVYVDLRIIRNQIDYTKDEEIPPYQNDVISSIIGEIRGYIGDVISRLRTDIMGDIDMTSDRKSLEETIMANEYVFYESGKIAPSKYLIEEENEIVMDKVYR
jgi:hypothetical protein